MADTRRNAINQKSEAASTSSRLQRRRPASLQIRPASASTWNAAIPLLSPLCTSPTAVDRAAAEIRSASVQEKNPQLQQPVVFKKWQHPAAPFCYEQPAPSFYVPV